MECEQVKAKLLPYVPELNAAGIVHLDVHGSVARCEATPSSDVDLIADFDRAKKLSLLGRVHLENRLARAQRESILVF
jgi:predicted nucleotidyltransferase